MELIAAYLEFAEGYYRESNERDHIKYALRPLKALYGRNPVAEFGPLCLKTVRDRMVSDRLTRQGINKRVERIRRVFRWGVENELVDPGIYHALQAVRGLARGRTSAPESPPVKPVPEAFVDAIESCVLPQVWTMIQLQLITAMRPGEVVRMRTADIDTTDAVWVYSPDKHKNAHRGRGNSATRTERPSDLVATAVERIAKPGLRDNSATGTP